MFSELKISFKMLHFESPEDIQSNVMTELKGFFEHDFQQCF